MLIKFKIIHFASFIVVIPRRNTAMPDPNTVEDNYAVTRIRTCYLGYCGHKAGSYPLYDHGL